MNIQVGALILKELTGLLDEEMLAVPMVDIHFQYALHTTSFQEQPMSDRTLGVSGNGAASMKRKQGLAYSMTQSYLFSEKWPK